MVAATPAAGRANWSSHCLHSCLPHLRRWLSDQFTAKGSGFMQASVSFLDGKLRSEQPALQVRQPGCHGVRPMQ